jgi:mono/diheme cytochrome c family protein
MNKKILLILIPVLALLIALGVILIEISRPLSPEPVNLSPAALEGKALFLGSGSCNSCHPGEGRKATFNVPALSATRMDDATIAKVIREGVGTMPANKKMTDSAINQIVVYINALKAAV